jgi:hypothetical protein
MSDADYYKKNMPTYYKNIYGKNQADRVLSGFDAKNPTEEQIAFLKDIKFNYPSIGEYAKQAFPEIDK